MQSIRKEMQFPDMETKGTLKPTITAQPSVESSFYVPHDDDDGVEEDDRIESETALAEAQVRQSVVDAKVKEKENELIANLEVAICEKLRLPSCAPRYEGGEAEGWQETQMKLIRDIDQQWQTEVTESWKVAQLKFQRNEAKMSEDIERVIEILKPKPKPKPPTPPPSPPPSQEPPKVEETTQDSDALPDSKDSDSKDPAQRYTRLQETYREMKKFADDFEKKVGEGEIKKFRKGALKCVTRPLTNSLVKVSKFVGTHAKILLEYQKAYPDACKYVFFRMSEIIVKGAMKEGVSWKGGTVGGNVPYSAFLCGLNAFMKNNDLENYLAIVLSNECPYVVPHLENARAILGKPPNEIEGHIKEKIERGLRFYMSLLQVNLTPQEKSKMYHEAVSFMRTTPNATPAEDIASEARFHERMTGLFGGIRRAWTWVAAIINHGNHPLTANLLLEWIQDCAPTMRAVYGNQFDKILLMIYDSRQKLLIQTAQQVPGNVGILQNAASVTVKEYINWLRDPQEQYNKRDFRENFRIWKIEEGKK
uniref:Nucleoporin GLE1 n=1 Tax=Lotharella globosa TaxID=91324 RepID=A0A7S3ZBR1_9EUKA